MSDDGSRDGRDLWRRYAAGRGDPPKGVGCPDAVALAAFLDGTTGEAERARVEAHLARCASCLASVEEARTIAQAPLEPLAEAHLRRLTRAVAAERRGANRVPDWLPLAAALLLTCGTGFWLGARAATQAAAVGSDGSVAPFGLPSLPVVNVP
jgi:anti-sigma factor RsiW